MGDQNPLEEHEVLRAVEEDVNHPYGV